MSIKNFELFRHEIFAQYKTKTKCLIIRAGPLVESKLEQVVFDYPPGAHTLLAHLWLCHGAQSSKTCTWLM